MPENSNRHWEIDSLRGLAVIMMVVFHIFFDLDYFNVYSINLKILPVQIFQYFIATTFITIVGISLTLSFNRKKSQLFTKRINKKLISRGLKIFCIGMLITVITWFYPNQGYIVFGILHFIGFAIILAIPFLKHQKLSLYIGIISVLFGIFLRTITVNFDYLFWLGLRPDRFYTLDYFPLFPWFGVVLIGVFFGNLLYPGGRRRLNIKDYSNSKFISFFEFLGRKSLIIYLLHQPIIVGMILLLS